MPAKAIYRFDPGTFAKLMARFDTVNSSDAEAMNAALSMRRMVAAEGLRIVDVLERADVKQALDAQLQPVREDSPELKAAFLEVAKYAELAKKLAETVNELREKSASGTRPSAEPVGLVNGGLVAFVVLAAIVLMIAAECH